MSRTYRRKTYAVPRWVTHDWEVVYLGTWDGFKHHFHKRVPLEGNELKKALNEWHSDHMWVQYPPDKPFRSLYGHRYDRQRARHALHKEKYALEYGNELFDKPRDLMWLWY